MMDKKNSDPTNGMLLMHWQTLIIALFLAAVIGAVITLVVLAGRSSPISTMEKDNLDVVETCKYDVKHNGVCDKSKGNVTFFDLSEHYNYSCEQVRDFIKFDYFPENLQVMIEYPCIVHTCEEINGTAVYGEVFDVRFGSYNIGERQYTYYGAEDFKKWYLIECDEVFLNE